MENNPNYDYASDLPVCDNFEEELDINPIRDNIVGKKYSALATNKISSDVIAKNEEKFCNDTISCDGKNAVKSQSETKIPNEIYARLTSLEVKIDKILQILTSGNFVCVSQINEINEETKRIEEALQAKPSTKEALDTESECTAQAQIEEENLQKCDTALPSDTISEEFEDSEEFLDNNVIEEITTSLYPYSDQPYDPDAWLKTVTAEQKIKPKLSFEMKMRLADENTKNFYNEIKNELLSYGLHCRLSRFRENFSKNRNQIARMVVNGKTLKCYLGIDPKSLDEKYYHHKDVSDKKGTADLPTMINVKSKIAVRKIKELIEIITEDYVIFKKKKFESKDFACDLTLDGFEKIELKGYDYMIKSTYTREDSLKLPEFFAEEFIGNVLTKPNDGDIIKFCVGLDVLCSSFEPNHTVDLKTLIAKGIAPADSNFLSILDSEIIDRSLIIYCDEITPIAAKMVIFSGGKIYRNTTNDIHNIAFDDLEDNDFIFDDDDEEIQ